MTKSLLTFILPLTTFLISCGQTYNSNVVTAISNDTLNIPSTIKMVAESEPGDPMIISGTIYLSDGKTPGKDAILSVWHTDTKGYYIEGGGGAGEEHPRIHGRMKTGSNGKYEFRTIRPAQYPSHTSPGHVHGHIYAPNFPEYPIIYYFDGDDLITDKNRSELNNHYGGTPSIIKLTKDNNGIFIGHRDIILQYVKPSDETMKLKW